MTPQLSKTASGWWLLLISIPRTLACKLSKHRNGASTRIANKSKAKKQTNRGKRQREIWIQIGKIINLTCETKLNVALISWLYWPPRQKTCDDEYDMVVSLRTKSIISTWHEYCCINCKKWATENLGNAPKLRLEVLATTLSQQQLRWHESGAAPTHTTCAQRRNCEQNPMEVTLLDVEELQNLGCEGGRLRGKGGGGCFALVSQLLISWAGFGGPGADYKLQPRQAL